MATTIESTPKTHPQMSVLATGKTLKILEVSGTADMTMPWHLSTEEAVVEVKQGMCKIIFTDSEIVLEAGDSFLIPAGKMHCLTIINAFQAVVVMPAVSDIVFEDTINM